MFRKNTELDISASTASQLPTDRHTSTAQSLIGGKLSSVLSPVKKGVDLTSKRLVFKGLSYLQFGSITLIENYGKKPKTHLFGEGNLNDSQSKKNGEIAGSHPLHVTLTVHNPNFYRQLITGGDIALADSYIDGEWEADDLTALIRLAARNINVMKQLQSKLSLLTKSVEFKKHKARSNTVSKAKSNILAHYDLGNDMYQTFLDKTMMYSSAIYPTPNTPLPEAQQTKLKTLCDMLELTPDDHLLEIGTGWGGLAIFAVQNYGCQVTTTTISDAQYDEAKQRVEQAGLTDKITLLKEDYRKLTGQYDKLISIEMVEAVGHEYLPTFFAKCNALLKPKGIMAMQAITFNDQGYEDYLNSVDFIQSHIFPGGCLLSNQEIINQFTEQTDMVVKSLIDYGYDYAYTLRDWRHAFMNRLDDIRAMGYDDKFIRLWQFYFAYSEGGFLERTIGVVQVKAIKE
ncbi:cyclopropane-fatty-acyl-phospholipid synthase family protein [Psychrobacter sp. HD31]|uniref:class I SAM-dependent methyltransferase n=1 Tax=Psychrobacter sp. HD31 TaxID=3112003 RepID=UPI003DA478B4